MLYKTRELSINYRGIELPSTFDNLENIEKILRVLERYLFSKLKEHNRILQCCSIVDNVSFLVTTKLLPRS